MIDPLFGTWYDGSKKSKQGVNYEKGSGSLLGGLLGGFTFMGRDPEVNALPTSGRIERPETAIRGIG